MDYNEISNYNRKNEANFSKLVRNLDQNVISELRENYENIKVKRKSAYGSCFSIEIEADMKISKGGYLPDNAWIKTNFYIDGSTLRIDSSNIEDVLYGFIDDGNALMWMQVKAVATLFSGSSTVFSNYVNTFNRIHEEYHRRPKPFAYGGNPYSLATTHDVNTYCDSWVKVKYVWDFGMISNAGLWMWNIVNYINTYDVRTNQFEQQMRQEFASGKIKAFFK